MTLILKNSFHLNDPLHPWIDGLFSSTHHEERGHVCHLGSYYPGIIGSLGVLSLHTFLPLHCDAVHIFPRYHDLHRRKIIDIK